MAFWNKKKQLCLPPPQVPQKYRIENINPNLPALRQETRPVQTTQAKPSQVQTRQAYTPQAQPIQQDPYVVTPIPRHDTTPKIIDMVRLDFICSHYREWFSHIYAQTVIGQPYQLIWNGWPEETTEQFNLAAREGIRVSAQTIKTINSENFDWSNFQCFHCGAGPIAGDPDCWMDCFNCPYLSCTASVVIPRRGQATAVCGYCGKWGYFGDKNNHILSGRQQVIDNRRLR